MPLATPSTPRKRGHSVVVVPEAERAELFSIGQLEQHARTLAGWHALSTAKRPSPDVLLPRLDHNERVFARAYTLITNAVGRGRRITPAAEWFIDNWPLIEEQIRTARLHLPRGYSRELPRLVSTSPQSTSTSTSTSTSKRSATTPRVYQLALEIVSHSHGHIDEDALHAFFTAYQSVAPLRLGELWATPIMLRLALLEDLRRVVANVTAGRRDRERARHWTKRMIELPAARREEIVLVLAELVRDSPKLTDAFVAEFATRLQAQGTLLSIASSWLDLRLAEQGRTVAQVFQDASQNQAKDQVSIGNIIGGLRFLSATNWQSFVEAHSVVDAALCADPVDVYAAMDFSTRDRYRHAVEALARRCVRSGRSELQVATEAVACAAAARAGGRPIEEQHVGYWLIDSGVRALEDVVGVEVDVRARVQRAAQHLTLPLYAGSILVLTAGLCALVFAAGGVGGYGRVASGGVLLLLVVALSQVATAAVQWAVTSRMTPRLLARLDFRAGIPAGHASLVAVPCLLSDVAEVDRLVEDLELRFLANRDPQLHFALLSDFRDADAAVVDDDHALLARARAGVLLLNARHGADGRAPFLLLHRPRRFNASEGVWMGHERKRGKLEDLNHTLRGATDRFDVVVGDLNTLRAVRSVIALDSDTQLPRDAAQVLVATLAHPLNAPVYDQARGRVVRGYAILQPRVGVSMESAAQTRFAQIFAGEPGIDPYSRAVSDVYQDLFGEGSFVGKGIYDVDTLHRALAGRFPDNRVLSHDLLEGAVARCGLVSDVMLIEEQPAAHRVDLSRRSRWVRGDWQIASWLLPRVPRGAGAHAVQALSPLSRWKIADNLRRSVVAPALLALLLLGAWASATAAAVAALTVCAVLFIPGLFTTCTALLRRPDQVSLRRHLPDVAQELRRQGVRDGLALAWLPIDAALALEAIALACVRMLVTKRLLLQWRTAADAARSARRDFVGACTSLWVAPAVAIGGAAIVGSLRPTMLPLAAPLLALWFCAPALSWFLGIPRARGAVSLIDDDVLFLRLVARRTWRFFAVFTSEADHHIIPDNFQEDPPQGVAHRTSPTNIGLGLTATLAAHDFGYVGVDVVIDLTTKALATLDRLERHRGHFYNWYDTRTLAPLRPLYVSTVDSGNLAGHLLTLAAGLEGLLEEPLVRARLVEGLEDTLTLYAHARGDSDRGVDADSDSDTDTRALAAGRALLQERCRTTTATAAWLRAFSLVAAKLPHSDSGDDAVWAQALRTQAADALRELEAAAPWTASTTSSTTSMTSTTATPTATTSTSTPTMTATPAALALLNAPHSRRALAAGALLAALAEGGAPISAGVRAAAELATARARVDVDAVVALAARVRSFAVMDFGFLYDKSRRLLAIGKNITDGRLDQNFYDLLASEARLASYIAIAQGQLNQEHWFSLGRSLTTTGGIPALLSWSGSMFEYLMPLLIMPSWPHTLLDETCRGVVKRHIEYGVANEVPWGVSESGYMKTDAEQNYQYRAFGVPGLGYKRGLDDDIIVAPYASVMALMVDPAAAVLNLRRLEQEGRLTSFGYYEAIDYTASRLPPGKTSAVVRSFMAHHQGMSLLALASVLLGQPMQRRFLADPTLRATELLLQERVPRTMPIHPHPAEVSSRPSINTDAAGYRVYWTPDTPRPEVQLLSNGRYHVAVTNAGGGYSRWRDLAVTRWREDPTRDQHGSFIYLKDVDSGAFWSAGHQPTLKKATSSEAVFSRGRAELRRFDDDIETHVEIAVSPEDDVELRRLSITNRGSRARTLEVTTYAEVVIAPVAADTAHPAFSNLFVQTELLPAHQAILATRRPRSGREAPPTMLHVMTAHGPTSTPATYETSREAFIGRGRSVMEPVAMERALTNSCGAVLDPIVAVRCTVVIEPNETARFHIVTGVAEGRDGAVTLVEKYRDRHAAERVLELAWTHSQVLLRRLNATDVDVQLYERLASSILYSNPALRAPESLLQKNRRGQSGLWGYGISGDLPIVLVRIGDLAEIALVEHLLKAHAFWRQKGLIVDVVIWNEDPSGYRQELHDRIGALVTAVGDGALLDRPGGVFVRRGDQMSEEDKVLMQAAARLIVSDTAGTLAEQMERSASFAVPPEVFAPRPRGAARAHTSSPPSRSSTSTNGHGAFNAAGDEYVITTTSSTPTPAPWVNVIANPWFGTVVSESGSAYTWCENAHSNRLTPWSNDPVSDGSGESFWLRDEDTGDSWSPTPLPAPDTQPYTTRHGFGVSTFEHKAADGIASSLQTFVAADAPLKFVVVKLTNASGRARAVSLTGCMDLVLGAQRALNAPHVGTTIDPKTGALFAVNPYNTEFQERVAFFDCSEARRSVSGDRTEVLGRNGDPRQPAALSRGRLSGRVGGGLDPCFAMQVVVALAPGEEREVAFIFGSGRDRADALTLVQRFRGLRAARVALAEVRAAWTHRLGAVTVKTPDSGVNALANGWLLYQVVSARLWARSGFYQSGGAFGFRDQLQDTMALVHAEPALLRAQLLRCAGRQFREGDVQHWWHPPLGRGVRTRISDDYLWLPFAACRYVDAVGDAAVLDERVPFLAGRAVRADEDSYYDLPAASDDVGSVYDHCVRAIVHGLRVGVHGLPLMGTGDWNDGMNLVGDHGRGESVWLGMFLVDVLQRFSPLARRRGDVAFADRCDDEARRLREHLDAEAWDGAWYKRAWFDDGAPLGSQESPECQIDALPQSWAVLAGIGSEERRRSALAAVDERLVDRELKIIRLFHPPFDGAGPEPGYIRGYVPGVRENGGQYTHAAVWTVMAFAAAGDVERAWELFQLINPVRHGDSAAGIARYRVEPYVAAADVYSNASHAGRGGWTWYTGSAGWMYRLLVESLLGITLEGDRLRLAPKLPAAWPSVDIRYRHHETVHLIHVRHLGGDTAAARVTRVVSDGVEQADASMPLHNDAREHHVLVDVGDGAA